MMTKAKQPPGLIAEFVARYAKPLTRAERQIEHEVFGTAAGIVSYTTPAQADALAGALGLDAGTLLLDVGAGAGWPGLYLAERRGCRVVLTDVPGDAMRMAAARAAKRGLEGCSFAQANGGRLPFRGRSFDAAVLSDVL